jgi:hypothetical protein
MEWNLNRSKRHNYVLTESILFGFFPKRRYTLEETVNVGCFVCHHLHLFVV